MQSLKGLILNAYQAFNRGLYPLESLHVSDPVNPLPHPLIFILGAPRSGTTLIYQALITAFDFSYFSNAHCWLYGAPWLVERVLHPSDKFDQSSFDSRFGSAEGWKAPSECGPFWYRFFRRHPQYVSLEDVNPNKLKKLRASIWAFQKASHKPLLIKNLPCALRLEPLMKTFPEAVFLVVHRNEADTAHSILEARKKLYGSYDTWFSLEPHEMHEIKKYPPHQQAVRQIRSVYREINRVRKETDPAKFTNIRYEDFCSSTHQKLEEILMFFRKHSFDMAMKNNVPESFQRRTKVTIDQELHNQLLQYVNEHPDDE